MKSSELKSLARENLKGKWGNAIALTFVYLLITTIISSSLLLIPMSEHISYTIIYIITSIIICIISPIISFGILASFIKLSRNQETKLFGFITDSFKSFTKIWGVTLYTILKMLLPILILVAGIVITLFGSLSIIFEASNTNIPSYLVLGISGLIFYIVGAFWTIIKSFSYILTNFILYDEPELPSKEIVKKSETLMNGNKWRYFLLQLSFVLWYILIYIVSDTFSEIIPSLELIILLIGNLFLTPYIQITNLKFYEELVDSNLQ